MQRRSTTRSTPRKRYTVDAFEGIPELSDAVTGAEADVDGLPSDDRDIDFAAEDAPVDESDGELQQLTSSDAEAGEKVHRDSKKKPHRRIRPRFNLFEPDETAVKEAKSRWLADPTFPQQAGFQRSSAAAVDSLPSETPDRWLENLEQRQKMAPMTKTDAQVDAQKTRSFVMGPHDNQSLFTLAVGQSMPLSKAWPASKKDGFMLNLGSKVHCLDWAPHQDSTQYLTVSATREPFEQSTSQIHIWKVGIGITADLQAKMILSTDWGPIRLLKWCQFATSHAQDRLGLLALLTDDGTLRVISVPFSGDSEALHVLVEEAAFHWKPLDCLCTCVAWLGPDRLTAGCSDGNVVVFDLSAPSNSTEDGHTEQQISKAVASSCIVSMSTCYPSQPQVVVTTSMNGYLALTDFGKSPPVTLRWQTTTLYQPVIAWHDFMQCPIAVDDAADHAIKAYPLLDFRHKTSMVGRVGSFGTCMAVSLCHPCILVGTAGGNVVVLNPLQDARSKIQQLRWFAHQWRRPQKQSGNASEDGDAEMDEGEGVADKHGLSRILEGFKVEHVPRKAKDEDNSPGYMIHEEATAITALAWNPNFSAAGWAAAGMGDGLVRIEDIGK